jgi:hypothetical protein
LKEYKHTHIKAFSIAPFVSSAVFVAHQMQYIHGSQASYSGTTSTSSKDMDGLPFLIVEQIQNSKLLGFCHSSATQWGMQRSGLVAGGTTAESSLVASQTGSFFYSYILFKKVMTANAMLPKIHTEPCDFPQADVGADCQPTPFLAPVSLLNEVHVIVDSRITEFQILPIRNIPPLWNLPVSIPIFDPQSKLYHKRAQAVNELISSEATYISKMLRLIRHFVQPLSDAVLDVPHVPLELVGADQFSISPTLVPEVEKQVQYLAGEAVLQPKLQHIIRSCTLIITEQNRKPKPQTGQVHKRMFWVLTVPR